jgi:ABC-2 type transport system permease protein
MVMGRWLRSYWLLMRWSVLRLRAALPSLIVLQTLIGVGVVVGFSFLIPDIDPVTARYLSTGALTTGLITVGMVAAPQLVAQQKVAGIFDYQRTMPVPRLAMLAADGTVWLFLALPGLVAALGIAALRFDLPVDVSPWSALAVPLVATSALAVGYSLAYAAKPEVSAAVTQVVFLVALMFAPINYPADQLPDWLAAAHRYLPFTYMAQAIRETVLVPAGGVSATPLLVLAAWCVVGLAVTHRVMSRQR